jgi:hypothetical protein
MTGTILETVCQVSIALKLDFKIAYLFDHTETVGIVPLEVAGTHESEDRHDVVQDSIGNQSRKFRCDEQSTLGCSWVGRS